MMAMTTRSSISVKPLRRNMVWCSLGCLRG